MAGNKHKNGIVCMYPGCEKKMRTQKFKGHFVKAHLREGEEYTVDHRRQFEVAQTEPLADSDSASATASPMELMGGSTPKVKAEPVKRASLDVAKKVADAMAVGLTTASVFAAEPPRLVEPEVTVSEPTAPLPLPPPTATTVQAPAPVPTPALTPVPAQAQVSAPAPVPTQARAKRPAAAMASETLAVPPGLDDSTMVKMLMIMDRRFNELTAKMDDMVEMQRLLFSAIMSKEPATDEQATKKRKDNSATIV